MKESERLAEKGIRMLQRHGWAAEAIEEVVTTLMAAGMAHWAEEQQAEIQRKDALIAKVAAN